ncbi:MAG: CpaF family protein [Clostridiales bacterium]|nr:CpaF family protein [Clostridiales bacterium]
MQNTADDLPRKKTVITYGRNIEEIVKDIRKWITAREDIPNTETILSHTEDAFFRSELSGNVDISEIRYLIQAISRRVTGRYGILTELLDDPSINEIMVNGPGMIFVEKNRELMMIDDACTSCDELEEIIRMFASDVHREVNEANPIVDARLPSGYRVNGVLKTVALNGPILTIRKFRERAIEMEDLISYRSITPDCARDLGALVKSGYNIFISGGTSTGKTTFLNALTASIGPSERVIIIEDSAELMITHLENRVHLECRAANSIGKGEVTMERLIRTSLRMRPDRIIVGEVRGREVVDMIQAMNTGHDGSMSTGHGNSIRGMLNRLETMYLMDSQVSVSSVRNQIANAVDVFVHLRRDHNGSRKVEEVAELKGFDGTDYIINYLYKADSSGKLLPTGNALSDRDRLIRAGLGDLMTGKRER